ncbi:hypothetical protein DPEC_G00376870 [Dallia pectoralis]|nr:hypothetical protein DPEC_G00376870 [Dallia pectoralis]
MRRSRRRNLRLPSCSARLRMSSQWDLSCRKRSRNSRSIMVLGQFQTSFQLSLDLSRSMRSFFSAPEIPKQNIEVIQCLLVGLLEGFLLLGQLSTPPTDAISLSGFLT